MTARDDKNYIVAKQESKKKRLSCDKIYFIDFLCIKKASSEAPRHSKNNSDHFLGTFLVQAAQMNKTHNTECREWVKTKDIGEKFGKFDLYHRNSQGIKRGQHRISNDFSHKTMNFSMLYHNWIWYPCTSGRIWIEVSNILYLPIIGPMEHNIKQTFRFRIVNVLRVTINRSDCVYMAGTIGL